MLTKFKNQVIVLADNLGIDEVKREEKINEYLELFDKMKFKDKPLLFSKFQEAIKELIESLG